MYFLIILIRIIVAPLIFIWPLPSIILSFFLDAIDGDFAALAHLSKIQYQHIDKILDYWVYIFEFIYAFIFWPDFKAILTLLFIIRTIGTLIFYLIKDRRVFFVFGNYFENIFFVIFFGKYFINLNYILTNHKIFYSLVTIVTLIKVFQEWYIHIAQKSFVEDMLKIKRNWKT